MKYIKIVIKLIVAAVLLIPLIILIRIPFLYYADCEAIQITHKKEKLEIQSGGDWEKIWDDYDDALYDTYHNNFVFIDLRKWTFKQIYPSLSE